MTLQPNILIFFADKMRAAKASHIFSTKNIGKFKILRFEILMKRKVTRSLVFEQLINNGQSKFFRTT